MGALPRIVRRVAAKCEQKADDVVSISSFRAKVAAVGALALAAGILVPSAAMASPLSDVHDFELEADGWTAYSNAGTVTTEVQGGEFCADVQGGVNPWDIAVQHLDVAFEEGVEYRLGFDASASRALTVPLQAGGNWPDVFAASLSLTSERQRFDFDVTPEFSAESGNIGFQLGGQGEAFRFCIDNVSMTSGSELLPQTGFAEGKGVWSVFGATAESQQGDALCVAVPPGGDPWSTGLVYNGVPIDEGANYVLSVTARTTPATGGVRIIVGEAAGSYRTVLEVFPSLATDAQTFRFPFTSSATFPADGAAQGQVAFHLGGKSTAYEFCITDVSLTTSAAPPPPYAPKTGPRVKVNQLGYLPEGPKRATLVTDAAEPVAFEVRDAGAAVVASGSTSVFGVDEMSGLPVHVVEFDGFTQAGTYTIAADGDESHPFRIDADLYQQMRFDALNYFYLARSGTDIEASIVGDRYARAAGHVNDPAGALNGTPNRGDVDVPCLTAAEDEANWSYGEWTCSDGYSLDVVGGWYDAGDHGKYVVNGGISVAQLMSLQERATTAPSAVKDALADGALNLPETGNGVPDVLDEARWQLEFFLSMQVPEGESLAGMVHHKIHDVGWTGLPLLPAADPQLRRLHRPSTAATLNLAATAAQGARLFAAYDEAFADRLLDAARTGWAAALANPDLYAPASAGQNGGGPYDDSEVGDEFYWAAAELFLTTGEDTFRDAVTSSPWHSADIFTPSGISWGETAGLGRLALATVPSDLPGREALRESVIAGAENYLAWQQREGFATTYSGKDGEYEWGSNSMVVNNQIVLGTAFDLTGDQRYADAVIEAMDYLLGRNALGQSYLTDYGTVFSKNQHSRWFANQLNSDLPNPPPASLAGGPNSTTSTWDPTITGLYSAGNDCTPQMCYVDHIQSWATNEITVNWNSAMSWVASFVADQGDGERTELGAIARITQHPVDVSATIGDTVELFAAATGDPSPTVRWQWRDAGGTWVDVDGADAAMFSFTTTADDGGREYRAVFANSFGSAFTDPATVTVTEREITVTLSASEVARGGNIGVSASGLLAGEKVEVWLNSTPILLGTAEASASGIIETDVVIPAQAEIGAHVVRVVGAESDAAGSAALQIIAAAPATGEGASSGVGGEIAETGSNFPVVPLALLAAALIALGAVLVLRRRRAQERVE